nr:gamma-aminobutyric acid receptor subunit beta-3-like [Pocillopora verrucosa]
MCLRFGLPAFVWILMALLLKTSKADYQETAEKLHEITDPDTYHKYLRPYHKGYAVNVTVKLTVVHFVAVREMNEEFSLDLVIWQMWMDARLKHSLNYSITLPANAKHLIWLPDTFFLNVRSATVHDVISENSKVSISPAGLVTYSSRITISAGCPMNLRDYPMDEQMCDLELSTYAYTEENLEFRWLNKSRDAPITVKDEHLAELALIDTETLTKYEVYADGSHTKLVARFWFKRRLGYALLQIYIPTIMLVVLSWFSFWIPEESVPARVALGSTTVLSIVTFTGSFRSSLPKVSYIKAVDVYFIVSFAFVFAVVFEYVLVLLNTGIKRQRRVSSTYLSGNNNEANGSKIDVFNSIQELQDIKVESLESSKEKSNKGKHSSVRKAKEYMRYAFVRNEGSSIDRVCRYIFPFCYAVFNAVYWAYYELSTFGKHPPSDM